MGNVIFGGLFVIVVAVLGIVAWSSSAFENFGYVIPVICLFVSIAAFLMLLLHYSDSLGVDVSSVPVGALGLPEGSVRAFLAISLFALVAVFGTFIYFESGKGTTYPIVRVVTAGSIAEAKDLQNQAPAGVMVVYEKKGTEANDQTQQVTYISLTADESRNDIAKQLLTMIMTLLTTVIGFYFGSRSGESSPLPASAMTLVKDHRLAIAKAKAFGDGASLVINAQLDRIGKPAAAGEDQAKINSAIATAEKLKGSIQGELKLLVDANDFATELDLDKIRDQLTRLDAAQKKVAQVQAELEALRKP
ncbi:hypothetical protein [Pararhizobium gei]|uniref:hypothetical protein n=1 Tax=Pararhizobium gei TaxID=1395951 RepID=UPI0023DB1B89|nr:hypothetical protein [Rhizobium gei]